MRRKNRRDKRRDKTKGRMGRKEGRRRTRDGEEGGTRRMKKLKMKKSLVGLRTHH